MAKGGTAGISGISGISGASLAGNAGTNAGGSGGQASTGLLQIAVEAFTLDGAPFDMWGIRVASASQDAQLSSQLLAELDTYSEHGVNTVAVFFQGSSGGYSNPFSADGKTLDAAAATAMTGLIEAAGARKMVVIVGIFYQRSDLPSNAEGVRQAVRTATRAVEGYGNVIVNIANEQNSALYSDTFDIFDFQNPARIIELCAVVHETDPKRLCGGGGYDHQKNEIIGSAKDIDVLLFDTSDTTTSASLYQRFKNAGVTNKPIVNVEMFGNGLTTTDKGVFNASVKAHYLRQVEDAADVPGLYVFFHNTDWTQREPYRFDLGGDGSAGDPGIRWYYEAVKSARGL